jgi:hypothetical protein
VSWVERDVPAGGPLGWLRDDVCAALLLLVGTQDPVTAAVEWNRDFRGDPAQFADRAAEWLAYYRDAGAAGIGYGALVVRRHENGTAWRRSVPLRTDRRGLAGEHVSRLVMASDLLGCLDGRSPPLRLAPDAELSRTERVEGGAFVEVGWELRLVGGLGYEVVLDAAGASLVRAFAVPTAVDAAVAATALSLGQAAPDITDPAQELVAKLVSLGFLVAAG